MGSGFSKSAGQLDTPPPMAAISSSVIPKSTMMDWVNNSLFFSILVILVASNTSRLVSVRL